MTNEVTYSDEVLAQAEAIVSANVVENEFYIFYLTLGQSGNSKDVRFVLYRLSLKANQYTDPFKFIKVLSDDLIEAAHKAKRICGNNPIVIDFERQNKIAAWHKWTPDVIRFGKNYGLKLSEVPEKYVCWIAKGCPLFDEKMECWCNYYYGGKDFQKIAQEFAVEKGFGKMVGDHFMTNEQVKKHEAKQAVLNSLIRGHHHNDKEKISKELTIFKVNGFQSEFGYVDIITFIDSENKVYTYKGSSFPESIAVGNTFTIKATVKNSSYNNQDETYIQRLKIQS